MERTRVVHIRTCGENKFRGGTQEVCPVAAAKTDLASEPGWFRASCLPDVGRGGYSDFDVTIAGENRTLSYHSRAGIHWDSGLGDSHLIQLKKTRLI